jgi:hypothetical protein
VFGTGEYAPQTESGRWLLSHELTHVVQQPSGGSLLRASNRLVVGGTESRAESEARCCADEVGRGGFVRPSLSQASSSVVFRQAKISSPEQASKKDDQQRLQDLWGAVKKTSIGQNLLSLTKGKEPKLMWGGTGDHRANFDGIKTITLNEEKKDELSDNQWKQVIAMELGNFAHKKQLDDIDERAWKGELSREEYVSAIVKVEFETRGLVNKAYSSGEFCDPKMDDCLPAFVLESISFEDYLKDSRGKDDRAKYESYWEENYKYSYLKKHRPGK